MQLLVSITSIASIFIGSFLVIHPALAIEIQRRFYRQINWEIKPISMEKEVRNTRIMGGILITFSLAALFFLFANGPVLKI